MDKIMSARIDESILSMLNRISVEKKITKKRIIEDAIRQLWEKLYSKEEPSFFDDSFGVWKRDEDPSETIKRSRHAFNKSMNRHQLDEEYE